MIAFLLAGVIVGALARLLRHDPDDLGLPLALLVGVVGAVVGGVGANLAAGDGAFGSGVFSFTAAVLIALVLLGLLEGRVGRKG